MQYEMNNLPVSHKRSWVLPSILGGLFLVSLIFGLWAFIERSDYKNKSDQKSELAVASALEKQKKELDAQFEQKEKSPYESYSAGSEFGSLSLEFPKTWELYVDSKVTSGSSSLDAYAHPKFVPGTNSDTPFALRFEVVDRAYASELKTFDSAIKNSTVTVEPFRPEKIKNVLGSKITGKINSKRTGVMYLLPLRDRSLKIWTESPTYASDLEAIMKTFNYAP